MASLNNPLPQRNAGRASALCYHTVAILMAEGHIAKLRNLNEAMVRELTKVECHKPPTEFRLFNEKIINVTKQLDISDYTFNRGKPLSSHGHYLPSSSLPLVCYVLLDQLVG